MKNSLKSMAKLARENSPLDPNKYYTIKELVQAFAEAGIPRSSMWIRRQEYKGNLKLPRSTTNFKKPRGDRQLSAVREMTGKQIKDVVQAFLPGGSGYYDYTKD